MSRLFKAPSSKNRYTGRICLSANEFENLKVGDTLVIDFDKELTISKTIESWMIEDAEDMGYYVLLPFANKHKP